MTIRVARADMLPDSPSWQNRFTFHGDHGDYVIAQNRAGRGWGCGCPRWRFKRECRHLDTLGLPGNERPCEATIIASHGDMEVQRVYLHPTRSTPAESARYLKPAAPKPDIMQVIAGRATTQPQAAPVKKPRRAYDFSD